MNLFNYWRSSTAYRVRIALELKGLEYERIAVNLASPDIPNNLPDYLAINPQGRIPSLVLNDGHTLIQSPAILEYLEEHYPTPALLPANAEQRARVRAVCALIACEIHPLNNVRTLRALRAAGLSEDFVQQWIARWIQEGFAVIERLSEGDGFCFGNTVSMADVYLIPQVYNARRFQVDISTFPKIVAIERNCLALAAFDQASPAKQPDATAHIYN